MTDKPRFDSVLVANRGEIACRVIRSANDMGYRTIAVYSEPDSSALHTKLADSAVAIGSGPASDSYLNVDKILAAAKQSGAQAIHPGYGFLSENASFAQVCENAGLVFIGPSSDAIEVMGNKAEAKRKMLAASVPCVPGYEGEQQAEHVLMSEAEKIGVPLMVKSAAGGGGRGMRLVEHMADLANAIKLARSEAENAFGSAELILERAILRPRHVEVQVFADEAGNTIHLGERDCSVQRRHQKVVEEAPCPVMTIQLREAMGRAAVAAAQSINYVGAGTVEFLLDSKGEFYFLEMNTRLQVEHPVTELVTGLDLVALQLNVAQGNSLGLNQEQVTLNGHAIEVRLYTEDPANDFLPTSGTISHWRAAVGAGVRVDDGVVSGQKISPFYDPMVAKIIAHGPNRVVARRRLIDALKNTSLVGVKHNKYFLKACLERPTFIAGQATTAFIAEEFTSADLEVLEPSFSQCAMAAVLDVENSFRNSQGKSLGVVSGLKNWSSASPLNCRRSYQFENSAFSLNVVCYQDKYLVSSAENNEPETIVTVVLDGGESATLELNGERHVVNYRWSKVGDIHLSFDTLQSNFRDILSTSTSSNDDEMSGQVRAPMHGQVLEVLVKQGQSVSKGDKLMVLEAMKMQHQIHARADGMVAAINVSEAEQVAAADILIELDIS